MTRLFTLPKSVAIAVAAIAMLTLAAPHGAQAEEFSDSQLKSFAVAWNSINKLAEEWKPQVEAAPSEDQADEMIKQFEVQANQVIEQTEGIGTTDYENIMRAAQSDQELKERIYAMLQEVQPK